jgi:hypothetical protein
MKFHTRISGAILALLCITGLTGCNTGPEMVPISGAVTFEGKPIPLGKITLRAIEGTRAPAVGGTIKDGKYTIDTRGGAPPGTYRVAIEAVAKVGESQIDIPGASTDQLVQYIPEKYNKNSELKLVVESGSGPMEKNFELTR